MVSGHPSFPGRLALVLWMECLLLMLWTASTTGVAINQSRPSIQTPPISANGTKRKCHRRLATSGFGRLTDIQAATDEVSD
jgi:hypothetical protein